MRKKRSIYCLILFSIFLALFIQIYAQNGSRKYKIIVNSTNPVSSLTREQLSSYFLKRTTKWSNGSQIMPIDLVKTSDVRAAFSEDVLHRRVSSVEAFWHKQIFSGRGIPPAQVENDSLAILYISRHPDGIGYVDANRNIEGMNVRAVHVAQ